MADDVSHSDAPELRDRLALDRTRLANERTLLAYVRTAFMLVVAGVTALKLFVESPSVGITAWSFIALGIFMGAFGLWRFKRVRRTIQQSADLLRRTEIGQAE
jgi:putative membrane protein